MPNIYFIIPNMYFRVNLKMKKPTKPTLCCCFLWIVFIEFNFTFAFLFIKKTWDDWFAGKVGGGEWGVLRNAILVLGGWFWNGDRRWGVMPLYWLCFHKTFSGISGQIFGLISSFLSNRQLRVVLDGKSSQKYPVNAGVPQGSYTFPAVY